MNLYKIFQDVNDGYYTYDSAIVAGESEEEVKIIHPSGYEIKQYIYQSDWCEIKDVQVEFIGTAKKGTKKGVILAHFNAG